jgi:adenylate cyclase
VVDALKVTLTDTEKAALEKVPTTDMEAYDFYIRGKQHAHGMDKKGLELARNLFTSAIIRDPNYTLAYCGLSDCYSMIITFYDTDRANVENALTAARKALELDADLAEAHASLGLALSLGGKCEEAEQAFQRAIEIAPKLFEAYYYRARSCRADGKLANAAKYFEKAHEVRPEEYEAAILCAGTYRGLECEDEVKRWFEIGLAAVEKHLEHHTQEARGWYFGAHALHELGDVDKARQWNERAMQLAPRDPATLYNAACLFSLMGEIDKAFECLNRAVEHGFANRTWTENDPDLDPIREDPRYEELLKGLPG